VNTLLPVAGFIFAFIFWIGLGTVLLTVIPGLRRSLSGVSAFVVGAFAGSFVVGRLTATFFGRPNGPTTGMSGLFIELAIGLAAATAVGLVFAWLLQRLWPKKT
jgi:hypothetical protein